MTFSMVTFEQTEKVETGLDVAIKAEDGRIIAWAYDIQMASEICHNLNNPATMWWAVGMAVAIRPSFRLWLEVT